jgi:exopolysaccharide biosynthesis polyprenyl glycosylphosphotransferase
LIELIDEYGLRIKIIPELYEILAGKVTMTNVMGTLLVDIETQIMQPWQRVIKRAMDILFSGSALLILWPFFIYIALKVKRSSDGPIFFIQERIGFKGRAFQMYKFRSMYTDAEKNGPLLSHASDDRITTWGKIMRKYRIDELPQLYHVLTGEMSLVGPRPERAFFAQQMIEAAPQYKYLYKVKPGLTSWGMVRFGYASDLKAMLERMQYDLLYIENYSLLIDLRILIHTVLIILKGRGV